MRREHVADREPLTEDLLTRYTMLHWFPSDDPIPTQCPVLEETGRIGIGSDDTNIHS